jgi:hypothetical protein
MMFCVKSLRLASFRAVLEDVSDAAPDHTRPPDAAASDGPAWATARFEQFGSLLSAMARGSRAAFSPGRMSHLYAEARGGAAAEKPGSTDDEAEQVGAALDIRPRLTARELLRIRRNFARENHPDRMPASHRDQATRRMVIANGLIDQALKALKPK